VSAPFAFYDGQNLLGTAPGALSGPVDLYTLLSQGLREGTREEVLDAVLARVSGRKLRIRAGVPLSRLELNKKELGFIELMRAGPDTPEALITGSGLKPIDAKRLLYLLTLIRGVEAAEGTGKVFASVAPPGSSEPPGAPPMSGSASSVTGSFPKNTQGDATASGRGGAVANMPKITLDSAPSVRPPAPISVPPTTASLPPPPMPVGLSAQDEARFREVASLYQRLDEITHYELLGVKQDATSQEISNAYFALVKRFHPDRLPPTLAPIVRCAQMIFDRVTEANETLTSQSARDEYQRAVAAGGGTRASERMMRDVLESTVDFQKAEVLVKRREYPQAMKMLQSAIHKAPDEPDYLALHAWLLHLMNPGDSAPFPEMIKALDKALSVNPRSERAFHYKGVILKRMKRDAEALSCFRQAAELNPRNLEAAREVRLATMRRDSKPPPGGSGKLLSKLFGKGD
jgi:curved DNA-binding protein CbpA